MIDTTIGNYRITGELARGGMGAVYRGRHQNLPREVVVKVILLSSFPPQAQDHLKARFVREAYVQSQLDHPNIVRVYEFFTTEENYYLVMEFVDGMSLRELVQRRGAIDPVNAVPLFKQALSALSYAHNFSYVDEAGRRLTGIIHRDIKPANILLDGMGRLKITDFGIVKLAGETGMTKTGFNPGTVEYMSPEQIRGTVVDARSDLYSLGVTFYEMLAGRLPFPPSDTGSGYEVMKGHTELPPPPLLLVKPDLPPALAATVMRSLEKDPANRFQTAAEWLETLSNYESGASGAEIDRKTEVIPGTQTDSQPQDATDRATEVITSALPVQKVASTEVLEPALTTNPMPLAQPEPARRMGLMIAGIAALVLIAVAAAYFVWSRGADSQVATASETPSVAPSATSTAATTANAENEQVKQARIAEEQERYADAIKLYDEYLNANPQASDHSAIAKQVAELRTLNGHLRMAKFFMDKNDFADAHKDYSNALKLRPDSKLAQAGLAEANARLSRAP